MNDFTIREMHQMQQTLHARYQSLWDPYAQESGKSMLLWMIGEIGEVIDIVKKNGGARAASDPALRAQLVEEMADVLMYYNETMLCYGITADELKQAYTAKFKRNMTRWNAAADGQSGSNDSGGRVI